MIALLRSTLESLNSMVVENLVQVRENAKEINILSSQPESETNKQLIRERYLYNRKLLSKNIEHHEAQLRVARVMENHKLLVVNKRFASEADMLQEVVSGEITFNEIHPKYYDIQFIKMLIEFYRHNDEFEKCLELKKHLKIILT